MSALSSEKWILLAVFELKTQTVHESEGAHVPAHLKQSTWQQKSDSVHFSLWMTQFLTPCPRCAAKTRISECFTIFTATHITHHSVPSLKLGILATSHKTVLYTNRRRIIKKSQLHSQGYEGKVHLELPLQPDNDTAFISQLSHQKLLIKAGVAQIHRSSSAIWQLRSILIILKYTHCYLVIVCSAKATSK